MTPALPHGMTPDELLEVCGPSWDAMTPEQRARYGPDHTAPAPFTPDDTAELLALTMDFPQSIRTEGLEAVAEKWARTDSAKRLARIIAAPDMVADALVRELATLRTPARRKAAA